MFYFSFINPIFINEAKVKYYYKNCLFLVRLPFIGDAVAPKYWFCKG